MKGLPKMSKSAESGCPAFTIPVGWAAFQFGLSGNFGDFGNFLHSQMNLVTDDQMGYISAHVYLSTQSGAGCIPASVSMGDGVI
jgi:hypothetical protein